MGFENINANTLTDEQKKQMGIGQSNTPGAGDAAAGIDMSRLTPDQQSQLVGGALHGQTGDYLHNQASNFQTYNQDANFAPTDLEMQLTAQQNQARQFAKDAPQIGEDLFNDASRQEQQNLARNISGIKQGYNSRGMLYSGMQQGAQLGAQAQSGSRLANAKTAINKELSDQVQSMNDLQIQSGLSVQAAQKGVSDNVFAQALYNMQNQLQTGGAIGGAIGKIAGGYLGSRGGGGGGTNYSYDPAMNTGSGTYESGNLSSDTPGFGSEMTGSEF